MTRLDCYRTKAIKTLLNDPCRSVAVPVVAVRLQKKVSSQHMIERGDPAIGMFFGKSLWRNRNLAEIALTRERLPTPVDTYALFRKDTSKIPRFPDEIHS